MTTINIQIATEQIQKILNENKRLEEENSLLTGEIAKQSNRYNLFLDNMVKIGQTDSPNRENLLIQYLSIEKSMVLL